MIVVTVYEVGGEQKFAVHRVEGDDAVDVSADYEVRALVVEVEGGGYVGGYHFGRRLRHDEVLEAMPKVGG